MQSRYDTKRYATTSREQGPSSVRDLRILEGGVPHLPGKAGEYKRQHFTQRTSQSRRYYSTNSNAMQQDS